MMPVYDVNAFTKKARPLRIGAVVMPYGQVSAVGYIHGERYYWFVNGGSVSMIPSFIVEGKHTDIVVRPSGGK
jgi:hypothetical protein